MNNGTVRLYTANQTVYDFKLYRKDAVNETQTPSSALVNPLPSIEMHNDTYHYHHVVASTTEVPAPYGVFAGPNPLISTVNITVYVKMVSDVQGWPLKDVLTSSNQLVTMQDDDVDKALKEKDASLSSIDDEQGWSYNQDDDDFVDKNHLHLVQHSVVSLHDSVSQFHVIFKSFTPGHSYHLRGYYSIWHSNGSLLSEQNKLMVKRVQSASDAGSKQIGQGEGSSMSTPILETTKQPWINPYQFIETTFTAYMKPVGGNDQRQQFWFFIIDGNVSSIY